MSKKNLQQGQPRGFGVLEMVGLVAVILVILLVVGVILKRGFRQSSTGTVLEAPIYLISPPPNAQPFTLKEPLINTLLTKALVGEAVGENNKIASVYISLQENVGRLEIKLAQGQKITGEVYVIEGPGLGIKNVRAENAGLLAKEYESRAQKSINTVLNNAVMVQKGRKLEYLQLQPGQLVLYYQR